MDAPLPTPTFDHDQTQDHHRNLMRRPRRHRSRERTRTGGVYRHHTHQPASRRNSTRKRMKHRETKRASHGKWRCMRVRNMAELGVQMPMVCETS